MTIAAWFEAYLGGRWYTFDPAQLHTPDRACADGKRRDAIDVAISTTFGPNALVGFQVWCDEDSVRLMRAERSSGGSVQGAQGRGRVRELTASSAAHRLGTAPDFEYSPPARGGK